MPSYEFAELYEQPLDKVTLMAIGPSASGKTTLLGSVAAVEEFSPVQYIGFDRSQRSLLNQFFIELVGWKGDPQDYPIKIDIVNDIDEVNKIFDGLKSGKRTWRDQEFKSVCLDNITEAQKRSLSKLLKSSPIVNDRMHKNVPGRFDYRVSINLIYQMLESYCTELRQHIFASCDEYVETNDDGAIIEVTVSVSQGLVSPVPRFFDIVGRLIYKNDQRWITTARKGSSRILRDKTSKLPAEVEPLWPEMFKYISGSLRKEQASTTQTTNGVKRLQPMKIVT